MQPPSRPPIDSSSPGDASTRVSDDSRLRVLHVVESWPPVESSSTDRAARIVAAQAAHERIEPHVAVSSRQHMYLDATSASDLTRSHGPLAGVSVHVAPTSRLETLRRRIRRFDVDAGTFERWIDREVQRIRPDVVHVHWSSTIGARSLAAAHRHGVPVVCEQHFDLAGAVVSQTLNGRLRPLEATLRDRFDAHLVHADAVVVASHSLARLVSERAGLEPVVVETPVSHPIERNSKERDADRSAIRDAHGVSDDDVLVGAIGTVRHYEGPDRVLETCRRLRADGLNVRPALIGSGPDLETIRARAAELDLELVAPGPIAPERLAGWYDAVDVTVVARRDVSVTNYSAPTKVLEAMAHGSAIVGTDVGDAAMLLEDGRGLVVDPDSDDALDQAVRELATNPDRRRATAAAAREWAETQAGWDTAADRLETVYRRTIRRRHSPGRQHDADRVHRRPADPRISRTSPDRDRRIAAATARTSGQMIVIGAGPAGLTAAFDAVRRSDLTPVVLEASDAIGGLSRTVEHDGNLIDIGGHRFFSKSERVTDWWLDVLPLERGARWRPTDPVDGPDPHVDDQVMLVRQRNSQILWNAKLFDYPLDLSVGLLRKLGLRRTVRAGTSYLRAQAFPVEEHSLEDFYVNRFGRELYRTFFESYTEKVWGVPCREISPDWGAQRVKGLSLWSALRHALTPRRRTDDAQRDVQTSLVERFLYPKYGPGQMWETVASNVLDGGGDVLTGLAVTGFELDDDSDGDDAPAVRAVIAVDRATEETLRFPADHIVSTLPLNRLVDALGDAVSDTAHEIADGLRFRDFVTVGVLVDNLALTEPDGRALADNWLYIQEPDVMIGRLQIFNNWSPWMVDDPARTWIGLEYFCDHTDPMWSWTDQRLIHLGGEELASIGVIEPGGVLDGTVIRVRRAYPSYFGTYDRLDELQPELIRFPNLWCAGRNGQHRYNNQDHSMLASMMSIDQITEGRRDAEEIWSVNIDDEYHEGS